jgi:hypothetical protein
MNKRQEQAFADAFGALVLLSRNSLTPTGARIAKEAAERCLYGMGLPEGYSVREFRSRPPDGPVIEAQRVLKRPGD